MELDFSVSEMTFLDQSDNYVRVISKSVLHDPSSFPSNSFFGMPSEEFETIWSWVHEFTEIEVFRLIAIEIWSAYDANTEYFFSDSRDTPSTDKRNKYPFTIPHLISSLVTGSGFLTKERVYRSLSAEEFGMIFKPQRVRKIGFLDRFISDVTRTALCSNLYLEGITSHTQMISVVYVDSMSQKLGRT